MAIVCRADSHRADLELPARISLNALLWPDGIGAHMAGFCPLADQ